MKNIDLLQDFIIREASKAGWETKAMQLPQTKSERFDSTLAEVVDLETRAFVVGLHPIILSELGTDLKVAPMHWSAAQQQAAGARTTVAADSGEDLVLIMIGPSGSRESAEWRSFAMEVERDDLVCRKLVWLPPNESTENEAELQYFLCRSFLAKPWLTTHDSPQTALDTLTEPSAALLGWQEILDRQPLNRANVDYDDLVDELIAAHES